MRTFRYPASALAADALRVGAGVAVAAVVAWSAGPGGVLGWIGLAMLVLFLGYGGRAWVRHRTEITADDRGLAARSPLGRRELAWADLAGLSLAYYSTRRDKSSGWFELRLKGTDGTAIRAESSLEGFADLCRACRAAARGRDLPLDGTTAANLRALGPSDPPTPAPSLVEAAR